MDAKAPSDPPDARAGAIILAAGRGVRMRSAIPKVLHRVGGIPMVLRVLDAIRQAGISQVVVVVDDPDGPVADAVPGDVTLAVQASPRGTGDAVRIGLTGFSSCPRSVLVVGGDTPLVTPTTLRGLVDAVPAATIVLAAAERDDPTGYGRVVLARDGQVERIVEEADASADERAIRLVNGMAFAFDGRWLIDALPTLTPAPNGELYLTALVGYAVQAGRSVRAVATADQWEIMGINTRRELAQAETARNERVINRLLDAGVTVVDPRTTYVDDEVEVGQDVILHPQTHLRGKTVVADGCLLGPGAEIHDSRLGAETRVWWSVLEGAETGARVHIGPYCRLRPGAVLEDDVVLGSFAEVKNSRVGSGTQMHHFGYLGDAQVGAGVNIGAGVITCNFDGETKHPTIIGAGAFVGSDTMLIAPVEVGAGAFTGAGAVVNRDVPDGAVVVGMPARRVQRRRKASSPDRATTEE